KEMTMEVMVSRGCGLDVHQATVVACLLTGEPGALPRKQVKTFSAMTGGLIELRDWLISAGCTSVAMEATGVYWKPVHNILEGHFDLVVLSAI
ncbi:MAG TPA: transposase, partial [Blastocatellia bacterium]